MSEPAEPPWNALPGVVEFSDGTRRDYLFMQRYHYRLKPPATWAAIRVARYLAPGESRGRLVGAAVLSYPVPMLRARLRHFGLSAIGYGAALRFANRNVLTISRVVVHPQFRSLGIAAELVRHLIAAAPSRYVECSATMADFSRFLEHAGMRRVPAVSAAREPSYFIFDKRPVNSNPEGTGE